MSYSIWSIHWEGSFFISPCLTDLRRELGHAASHLAGLLLGSYSRLPEESYYFEATLISEDVIASVGVWKNLLKQTSFGDETQSPEW